MLTKRTEREEEEEEEDGDGESSITTVDATLETAKNSSKRLRKSYGELPLLADLVTLIKDRSADISVQVVLSHPDILDLEAFKDTPFDYRCCTGCNITEEHILKLKAEVTYENSDEKKYALEDTDSIVIHGEISCGYYEDRAFEIASWLLENWGRVKDALGEYYFGKFRQYCMDLSEKIMESKTDDPAWWYKFALNATAHQIQTLRGLSLLYILKMV